MKRHSASMVAAVVLLATLGAGAAFVRLNANQQGAERRATVMRIASERASAIDAELNAVRSALRAAAAGILSAKTGEARASRAAAIVERTPVIQQVLLVEDDAAVAAFPSADDSVARELLRSARTELRASDEGGPVRSLVTAIRNRGVEYIIVILAVSPDPTFPASRAAPWVMAAMPVDGLLRTTGLADLPGRGYDVQWLDTNPATGQRRVLARSGESELIDAWEQAVPGSAGRWRLVIASRDGWTNASTLAIQVLLAALVAFTAAFSAYELVRGFDRVWREGDRYRKRLRIAKRRLAEEIEHREESERRFDHAGSHDAFTGLPNRHHLLEHLERWLRRARSESGHTAAVIVLDFDRWKSINDSLGHAAGDQILVETARRIEACVGNDVVIARVGGSELAVLLHEVVDTGRAVATAERLIAALAEPFDVVGQRVFATASAGIALCASGYERADALLRDADIALSKAHAMDGTRVTVFDVAEREHAVTSLQLQTDLHRAVREGEFRLVFQPIVSFAEGRITGMETLLRWAHPVEGMIAPDRFIRLAEDTGLIIPITRWVLRAACEQAAQWRRRLPDDVDFYLSVNLAAQDMRQPDLADYIARLIAEHRLPRGMLRFEVTEGSMIDNIRLASDLLTRLRGLGSPLLLDDFGTGYSSLGYLQRFQFDYLKIDRSFVSRIDPNGGNSGIVRAIVHLAHDLGLRTVAEGVETQEAVHHLRSLGCHYGQGYYYSRPVPADAMMSLLESRRRWHADDAANQAEAA